MTFLADLHTPMGNLDLLEVIVDYDGPRLFTAQASSGSYYLATFLEGDQETETFMFAPLSWDRLQQVRAGHLPLRSAFTEVPDDLLWIVKLIDDGATAEMLRPIEVVDEWLPDPEVRLSLPAETAPRLTVGEVRRLTNELGRPVLAVELDSVFRTTEFPLRELGEVMQAVQGNVDALGQVVIDDVTLRGSIQRDVLEFSELTFYTTRAASFAFLAAARPPTETLFSDPRVSEALEMFVAMIEASTSADALRSTAERVRPRAVSKYKELLEVLSDSESGIRVHLGKVGQEVRSQGLSRMEVEYALSLVQDIDESPVEQIRVRATLVGVNVRTHRFELYDASTDKQFSGKAVGNAQSQLTGLTSGDVYEATLNVITTYHPVTGELRERFELVEIA